MHIMMKISYKLYPNAYNVSYMALFYTLLGVLRDIIEPQLHILMVKIVIFSQLTYICTVSYLI